MDKDTHDNTTQSFSTIEIMMNYNNNHKKIRKIVFGGLILLLSILLILLFSLPQFHTSNIKITGNTFFSNDDIKELSEINDTSNLFLNAEKSTSTLISNSNDLILSCNVNTDGFTSSINVVETHPIGVISSSVYYSNGIISSEIMNDIDSISLNENRRESIKESYISKHSVAPEIHFPFLDVNSDSIVDACQVIEKIELSSLYKIHGFQFINDNNDSNWSNVVSVLIKVDDKYVLFEKVRSDMLKVCFSEKSFTGYISSIKKSISEGKMSTHEFSYDFDDDKFDVYAFKFIINDNKIRLVEKGK